MLVHALFPWAKMTYVYRVIHVWDVHILNNKNIKVHLHAYIIHKFISKQTSFAYHNWSLYDLQKSTPITVPSLLQPSSRDQPPEWLSHHGVASKVWEYMGGSTLWRFFVKINHPIFTTQQFFEKLPFFRLSIWASTPRFITSLTSSGWCRSPLVSLTQRQETWPTTSLQLPPGWTAFSTGGTLNFSTWDSQK